MKNVQIIDGADNATLSIFQATDDEFAAIFPDEGQGIELIEDLIGRTGGAVAQNILEPIWLRPIHKRDPQGIHGTLYFDYQHRRNHRPETKREVDREPLSINAAQRQLYARLRTRTRD